MALATAPSESATVRVEFERGRRTLLGVADCCARRQHWRRLEQDSVRLRVRGQRVDRRLGAVRGAEAALDDAAVEVDARAKRHVVDAVGDVDSHGLGKGACAARRVQRLDGAERRDCSGRVGGGEDLVVRGGVGTRHCPVERVGGGINVDRPIVVEEVGVRRRGVDKLQTGIENDAGVEICHLDARVEGLPGVVRIAEVGDEKQAVRIVDRYAIRILDAAGAAPADHLGFVARGAVGGDVQREDAGVDRAARLRGRKAIGAGIIGYHEVELMVRRVVDHLAQEIDTVGVGRGVDLRQAAAAADMALVDLGVAGGDRVVGDEVQAVGCIEGDGRVRPRVAGRERGIGGSGESRRGGVRARRGRPADIGRHEFAAAAARGVIAREPDLVGQDVAVLAERRGRERVADIDHPVGDVERPAAAQRRRADQAARGGDMGAAGRDRHLHLEQRAGEALADVAAVEQDIAAGLQCLADGGELLAEHADVGQAQDGVAEPHRRILAVRHDLDGVEIVLVVAGQVVRDLLHAVAVGVEDHDFDAGLHAVGERLRVGHVAVDEHDLMADIRRRLGRRGRRAAGRAAVGRTTRMAAIGGRRRRGGGCRRGGRRRRMVGGSGRRR